MGTVVAAGPTAGPGASRGARFALAKFRPPSLPGTLITRPALHGQLAAGAGQRLTVMVGSAGAGKTVLLADWAAARPPGLTGWLSCDRADADPVRFWAGFAEAPRVIDPGFGTDAADLLAMDRTVSADVVASLANDAAKLPAGSVIVVDDFHYASAAAAAGVTDLVERWPAGTVQLVLSGRSDPPLRQHRLRMAGELCEIRDRELYMSLAESRGLLANFGVQITDRDLALLHERSDGWPAALQMAALSLRGTTDRAQVARALEVRSRTIADYFVAEVLDQQPPERARFMLDTSVLDVLSADACAAVTGRPDAAFLLRGIEAAGLFLVAVDDERTGFRYHHLVRQVLRAELRARNRDREQAVELRAAEWFEACGEARRAAHHFLAARQADRALALIQDRVVPDFLREGAPSAPLDLGAVSPSLLAGAPDRMLALAADLLLQGDTARGGEYLDLLEQAGTIPAGSTLAARFAGMRSFHYGVTGRLEAAVAAALAARAAGEKPDAQETRASQDAAPLGGEAAGAAAPPADEWAIAVPLILVRVYNCLEDFPAATREAATALAAPQATEPVALVMVPGARALAWFESGWLAEAAAAASAADADARRLGFGLHFFAVDHLRVLSGLALERRDLDTAERLAERVLSITEQRRPLFEFLALLDRAQVWAARGHVRDALATVEAARQLLPRSSSPALRARADEQETLLRLALGDLRSAAELADRLPPARRGLLLARTALAAHDHRAAQEHLRSPGDLTPRRALLRRLLLAAAAIERGDPAAARILGGALHAARTRGFLNTVVTTAPQVTRYLVEHAAGLRPDPFTEQLIAAALEARAQAGAGHPGPLLAEPLTLAEQRVLALLPSSTYLQIADTLYISRNTVKTHLRSIYHKLGASSRAEALRRAVDLRLL